ncbi:DUF2584 family protein [Aquibacillus halophilus]|uniref:DUF2584 family protein n=1 Tax=Aquibacillus halophilus TaxID=930132 RepID=A0A6A8DFB9_9BACI|nr:DUF2584 family protein [Aquibacillus halophilus]MRH42471.1 DUF2584 family protein [Aquibacillus halophilus]
MSMPLLIEWKLITHGKEKRIANKDNTFEITFDGYKLFPIDEVIEIRRQHNSDQIGNGKIVELTWREDKTICRFKLLSLHNVN